MEYLFIYLLQITDTIMMLAILLAIVPMFIQLLRWLISQDDNIFIEKYSKPTIVCWIISILLFMLPTKQTLLLMGGTYLGKKAITTVVTDEKIKKVDTIINLQLDRYIKELQTKGDN